MLDAKKFVFQGPCKALTDTVGSFQECQIIYKAFLDPQKLFMNFVSRSEQGHVSSHDPV